MNFKTLINAAAQFNAEAFQNHLRAGTNFEKVLNKLKVLNLGNGKCKAELEIEETHTNISGNLHSGLAATIVDIVSSYGLATSVKNKCEVPHVSLNMSVRFYQGVGLGKTITIDSEIVSYEESLAFLEVTIKDKESGNLVAKGEHTKYFMNT